MKLYNSLGLTIAILLILIISTFILKPTWHIGSDGFGYYSYARSLIFDHNLDLNNEFSMFDHLYGSHTLQQWHTTINKTGNPFAVGASILWSPFILLAIALQAIGHFPDHYALVGYNTPFETLLTLGTWLYSLIGLLAVFWALAQLGNRKIAWWATILIVLCSPLLYYLLYEPSMSHALSFSASSLLFALTIYLKKKNYLDLKDYLFLGFLIGGCFILRWQDIIFAFFPLIFLASLIFSVTKRQLALNGLTTLAGFLLIAWPQFAVWKYLYGSWIAIPQGSGFFQLTHPHLFSFFFSGYHGLFIINPLLILGTVGLIITYRKNHRLALSLLVVLSLQIYINSALSDWYGGGSFGARRMISSLFIFAVGFASFLESIKNKKLRLRLAITIFALAVIFNILLIMSYARQIIPINKPTTISQVYVAPFTLIRDYLKR